MPPSTLRLTRLLACLALLPACRPQPSSPEPPPGATAPRTASERRASGQPTPSPPPPGAPRFAFVKEGMRPRPDGGLDTVACVEGTAARGAKVLVLSMSDGQTCRMVAAEQTGDLAGMFPCTALDGTCRARGPLLARVGADAAGFLPVVAKKAAAPAAGGEVAKVVAGLEPNAWCTRPDGPLDVKPSSTLEVGGTGLRLVQFSLRAEGQEREGPLVAVTAAGAATPLGYPAAPVAIFRLDGKTFLWTAETGFSCGARGDAIHAVEAGGLVPVHRSAFLGD